MEEATNLLIVLNGNSNTLKKPAALYTGRPTSANSLSTSDSMTQVDIEAKREAGVPEEWKPQKKELLIMVSLSFISLMVALDATVLVTVLPVSNIHRHRGEY
jgi:hypothetical protein